MPLKQNYEITNQSPEATLKRFQAIGSPAFPVHDRFVLIASCLPRSLLIIPRLFICRDCTSPAPIPPPPPPSRPSVGVKAGLQGRLLAGTHRDSSPLLAPLVAEEASGRGMDGSRDIRLYTGADWIGRGAQKGRPGQNKGTRLESLSARGSRQQWVQRRGDRVQNQSWFVEKRPWLRLSESWGWSNQPPTAKNLIRCHNYTQWRSTSIEELGSTGPWGALVHRVYFKWRLWGRRRRSARCFLGGNVRSLWWVSRLVLRKTRSEYSNVLWNLLRMSFPNKELVLFLEIKLLLQIRRFSEGNFRPWYGTYVYNDAIDKE